MAHIGTTTGLNYSAAPGKHESDKAGIHPPFPDIWRNAADYDGLEHIPIESTPWIFD
jgi:hypothetical protein